MPFCAHPLRALPDHLAGRAADKKSGHCAVAGAPASRMVYDTYHPVAPFFSQVYYITESSGHQHWCFLVTAGRVQCAEYAERRAAGLSP